MGFDWSNFNLPDRLAGFVDWFVSLNVGLVSGLSY